MKTYNIPDLWARILIVLVSIVPGFLTCLVFILGAEPFDFENSTMPATLGGCAAVFLFSTACQFWLARMGGGGLVIGLLVMAGMFGTALITCANFVSGGISSHNWPMLVSGGIGSVAGILLSLRRTRLKLVAH